jgi:hypothetical protein
MNIMIFDFSKKNIESEKERNFYYKFFAGYYFNELIPGYNYRVTEFSNLINNTKNWFNNNNEILCLSNDLQVSFDLHAYLFGTTKDRGECADIFIHDKKNDIAIFIEAKWLENWNFDKDINRNFKRIFDIKTNRFSKVYQCLLIKQSSYENCIKSSNRANSNFRKLKSNFPYPLKVITWDELINLVDNEYVRSFFSYFIGKNKNDFRNS